MPLAKPARAVAHFSDPLYQGLVLALAMDEGSGTTAFDKTGRGNNGVFNGALSWTNSSPNGFGYAVQGFTGGEPTTTYIDCGNSSSMNPTTGITLSVWVNGGPSASGTEFIIARDDNTLGRSYAFGVNWSTNQITSQINGAVSLGGGLTTVTKDVWHHILMTGDAVNGYSGYIDGTLSNTASWVAPAAATGSTTIGKRTFASFNQGFIGQIDSPMIWNRSLSQAEVSLLYFDTWRALRRSRVGQGKASPVPPTPVAKGGGGGAWINNPFGMPQGKRGNPPGKTKPPAKRPPPPIQWITQPCDPKTDTGCK